MKRIILPVDAASNRLLASGAETWRAIYKPDGAIQTLTDDQGAQTDFEWNPLGDMKSSGTPGNPAKYTYAYDVNGERVILEDKGLLGIKSGGGSQAGLMISLRGIDNKVRRDLHVWKDANNTLQYQWVKDYIYRGGQLLASVSSNPSAVVRHYHLDHLGSTRLVTDAGGNVKSELKLFPFGEDATPEVPDNGRQYTDRLRFTGHERDLGSLTATTDDMDYMHARYYKPTLGRFLSLDNGKTKIWIPGNWNRFGYALNNPIRLFDQDGNAFGDFMDGFANAYLTNHLGARPNDLTML